MFLDFENVWIVNPSRKTRNANFNGTLVSIVSCLFVTVQIWDETKDYGMDVYC